MPSRKIHEEFDRFLASKGVLLRDGKYGQVHKFMDLGINSFGSEHRNFDIYHHEKGLRKWLNGKYNVIGQDRASDWLRAGLGHLCLDKTESRLWKTYSWATVFKSAYNTMKRRGWTRARFICS